MNHRRSLVVAVLPVCVGLAVTAGPTFAGATSSTSTSYAFKASGFGTQVTGGQIPAGSSTTGSQALACTNRAGKSRSNNVAEATLPGLGTASGVTTRVWSTSHHGVVASHSTHRIAEITVAQSQLGTLSIKAIASRSTAYHDARGFHARTTTHLGSLTFTPASGAAQSFPAPTPDHPLTIPGLVTVYAGRHVTRHSGTGALATAFALRVDVLATGTRVRVARSHAELHEGLTGGIFSGRAAATHVVTAGGDIARSGPNPLLVMPCEGSYGKVREKSLASVDLGGQLVVKGAHSSDRGSQTADGARGMSRADVARVELGGGQVVVNAIVGKASVVRRGHHVTMSATGTRLAGVTVAGQQQNFPRTGVLEIPGVAKLERGVVTRSHGEISVIGLRITLLDGSGAVVNLAEATLRIRPLS
jgi:hypothetical protein